MPLKVSFELSDRDLRHFRKVMREARATAKTTSEEEIVEGSHQLLAHVRQSPLPDFVRERLLHIDKFLAMLADEDWALDGDNRERIVSALAYFNDPVDLIPDHIPGFGFIDDAVMVELVCQELQHDLEAYDDFCAFRKELKRKRRAAGGEELIESRRDQLHARMQRRRKRRAGRSQRRPAAAKKAPFSLW